MATNEIFKYGQWLSLPLPLRGDDPHVNEDPTRNGDPVLIGDIVGFAQEVGGVPVMWPDAEACANGSGQKSSISWMIRRNTANSLEPGWASVALVGAFCYPVEGWDPTTSGTGSAVGIRAAKTSEEKAVLVLNSEEDHWFGHIVGQTKMHMKDPETCEPIGPEVMVPIINVVQSFRPHPNAVPDKPAGS
ncbi:hypothetical protein [Streptomyces sp. 5-10]|uniref:hypothetical protein n=1 Tax=Streptomyces sp. 5-10 TaxID=878925 RepID=UPI00168B45B9|nr:hypothetical protein [Streptomyces sp. 5-10]MBD3004538.1 hypothetical protein [Streptomyces sp. 5-10]